jgi:hypothetical protein
MATTVHLKNGCTSWVEGYVPNMQCHHCGCTLMSSDAAFRDTACECGAKNFVDVATVPAPSSCPQCDCAMVKADDGSLACRWCEPRRSRVRPAVPIVGGSDRDVTESWLFRGIAVVVVGAVAVFLGGVVGFVPGSDKSDSPVKSRKQLQ